MIVHCVCLHQNQLLVAQRALKWDKEFENMIDPSGRSIKKVHKNSY